MVKLLHQFLLVLLVAIAPLIVLLLRGVVWGADSFAFMAVACGKPFVSELGHPFFANLVPLFDCNVELIFLSMFVIYFFCLVGIWVFGNFVFPRKGFLVAVLTGSLSPIFFLEALRFENQLFGFSLAFIGLGLFTLYLTHKKLPTRIIALFLACISALFSVLFWFPSILIVLAYPLLYNLSDVHRKYYVLLIFVGGLTIYATTLIETVLNLQNFVVVSEQLPLVGIIFVLHIIHLYKFIPQKFYTFGVLIIFVGLVQAKFMFLCLPFLILGVVAKELKEGLWIRNHKLPLVAFSLYILIAFSFSAINFFPTQSDIREIETVSTQSDPVYNDWGEGWLFEYLGFQTDYKKFFPQPDWNSLERPYYAYTKFPDELSGCVQVNTHSYYCS